MAKAKAAPGTDDDGPALDRIRHPKQRKFLAVYAETANVVRSARAAKIHRSLHYLWLDKDPEYARAFKEAEKQAIDIVESAIVRRAIEGTRRMILYKGEPVKDPETGEPMYELKYSDYLLIQLAKALAPEKYRESFVPAGADDDGSRIAGRDRRTVIAEEVAARQRVLEMIDQPSGNGN